MKYILILLLLSGCSTSILHDKHKSSSVPVEDRITNATNSKNSSVKITIIEDPKLEVIKPPTIEIVNPNQKFSSYSIYFNLDEYDVQDNYKALLKKHGEYLAKNPNQLVFIEGHTDERGGKEYNLALGQRRANAVRVELLKYGVKDSQMDAYSYGSEKPKAFGSNEEAWSQNRRVDLFYE